MPGLFGLSVNPAVYKGDFLDDLYLEVFYHQHRGEAYAGFSTSNGKDINIRTKKGLVKPNFDGNMKIPKGTEGIGYIGPAREPIRVNSKMGRMSLCFSGNIINSSDLINDFKNSGALFERDDDIEIIAHLVAKNKDIVDAVQLANIQIKGSFAILILTKQGIYATVASNGNWPLIIGKKEGAVAVASESVGFGNLGFKIVRDIRPGEIVLLNNGCWKSVKKIKSTNVQICSFLWAYTAFPNTSIYGIPASLVREKLGSILAKQDIKEGFIPDIVFPVPDSGRFHAIGYHSEFVRQANAGSIDRVPFYNELLLKYPYAGRSYTPQSSKARKREAYIKILRSGVSYKNKIIVACDDSIVRGTQVQTNLVPKLRELDVKEIHFRISNPELISHCPWGKTTKKGETLAERMSSIEDRIRFLGIDSLKYNSIDDLVKAIGLPQEFLCVDCSLKH